MEIVIKITGKQLLPASDCIRYFTTIFWDKNYGLKDLQTSTFVILTGEVIRDKGGEEGKGYYIEVSNFRFYAQNVLEGLEVFKGRVFFIGFV